MENIFCIVFILNGLHVLVRGGTLDNCPPADPNCHPSCIVYDARHCRYCRCQEGTSNNGGSDGDWTSGMSHDASWDQGFEGADWSNKVNSDNSWSSSGGGAGSNYGGDRFMNGNGGEGSNYHGEQRVQYVILEKEPEPSYSESIYPGGGISSMHSLPHPFPDGPISQSPFSSSSVIPSSLAPGSNHIVDDNSYRGAVIHVPLVAPGQPSYCVRCRILSCPTSCERVDQYGCHSCPCAPSRFQTMPIMRDCSNPVVEHREPDCSATKRCMDSCRNGYILGDVGSDGCRACSCFRAAPTTTPMPSAPSCPVTLSCMLRCKDGYLLGDTQRDGCPSCKCLPKGASSGHRDSNSNSNGNNNNNNNNNFNNNQNSNNNNNNWSSGSSTWNNNNKNNNNNNNNNKKRGCGRDKNYLTSTNGISSGKCEPPMCLDGHMSVDSAMRMGEESAGGRFVGGGGMEEDCTEGVLDGGSFSGYNNNYGGGSSMGGEGYSGSSGFGTGNGDSGSSGSGNCFPMCQNGNKNQINTGSSASTSNNADIGGGMSSGGSGAIGGCSGPFCAAMSGTSAGGIGIGGGGGNGGGGSGSGMPFSPFSSALSEGGPGTEMSGGGPRAGLGMGMSRGPGGEHKECPDLIHCLVTCDGSYVLGKLDQNGCQTCTCK